MITVTSEHLALIVILGIFPITIAVIVLFGRLDDIRVRVENQEGRDMQCEWCMTVVENKGNAK